MLLCCRMVCNDYIGSSVLVLILSVLLLSVSRQTHFISALKQARFFQMEPLMVAAIGCVLLSDPWRKSQTLHVSTSVFPHANMPCCFTGLLHMDKTLSQAIFSWFSVQTSRLKVVNYVTSSFTLLVSINSPLTTSWCAAGICGSHQPQQQLHQSGSVAANCPRASSSWLV